MRIIVFILFSVFSSTALRKQSVFPTNLIKKYDPIRIPVITERPFHNDSWEDGEIPWDLNDDNNASSKNNIIPSFVPLSPVQIAFLLI